ncbi:MAG TPA: hypothetical protein DD738_11915, partial [Ruminiclostridium sp.]|nr:hypothetical protein [Ruminiclostridium sp.]
TKHHSAAELRVGGLLSAFLFHFFGIMARARHRHPSVIPWRIRIRNSFLIKFVSFLVQNSSPPQGLAYANLVHKKHSAGFFFRLPLKEDELKYMDFWLAFTAIFVLQEKYNYNWKCMFLRYRLIYFFLMFFNLYIFNIRL